MHDQFANTFYRSRTWRKCRDEYARSRGGLCERCLARGIINAGSRDMPLQVHHRMKLTPENIGDPAVTLSWTNLELLCKQCHDEEHGGDTPRRWSVDADGRVSAR